MEVEMLEAGKKDSRRSEAVCLPGSLYEISESQKLEFEEVMIELPWL